MLYAASGSWQLAAASIAAGVLVDLDHVIDYLIEYGFLLDRRLFFRSFSEGLYRKIYILLHGWEWIAISWIAAALSGWNVWLSGIVIGLAHHMITDHFVNGASPLGYSLLWRIAHRWDPLQAFSRDPKWFKRKLEDGGKDERMQDIATRVC